MKLRITSFLFAALLAAAIPAVSSAQSTAFTYQGRLNQNGAPAQGVYDLRFTIHDLPTGGSPLLNPITNSVVVTNGLFIVLLDFGSDAFTGADRWLEIAVRPAGPASAGFTPLNPRQPITPTPYALTALTAKQVPGVSGNALHAADDSSQNAVFVDNAGNVGVGTATPQEKLDVRSGNGSYIRIDAVNGDIKANGGSDGHFGIFNDSLAASGGTHLIGLGVSRLFAANNGNVGIGTTTPDAKLDVRGVLSVRGGLFLQGSMDVRGDIRLGSRSELRAASSEENLRIVRGRVGQGGQVIAGTGFQVAHQPIETPYTITFTPPFAAPPTVTATVEYSVHSGYMVASAITANSVTLTINVPGGGVRPSDFSFIAIGPR